MAMFIGLFEASSRPTNGYAFLGKAWKHFMGNLLPYFHHLTVVVEIPKTVGFPKDEASWDDGWGYHDCTHIHTTVIHFFHGHFFAMLELISGQLCEACSDYSSTSLLVGCLFGHVKRLLLDCLTKLILL